MVWVGQKLQPIEFSLALLKCFQMVRDMAPCRDAVSVKFYVYPNLDLFFTLYLSGLGMAG